MTIQDVARTAEQLMVEHGHHAPIVVVEGSQESLVVEIADLPSNWEKKVGRVMATGYTAGRAGRVGELRQVFFIAEAWMSVGTQEKLPSVPPSKDPNRQEVLVISGRAAAKRQTDLVMFKVLRDPQGRLRGLQECSMDKGTAASPLLEAFVAGFTAGRQAAA
jgi:hypothetical protein